MGNDRKKYMQEWRKANSEKLKKIDGERSKKWYYDNINKAKLKQKEYYQKNKEKLKEKSKLNKKNKGDVEKEYQKKYRELNKNKRNLKELERRKTDIIYKLTCYIRSSINQAFKRNSYTKNSNTYITIGCTFEELKTHLESKFENWMDWGNYGKYNGTLNYGWDIDHIVPLSSAKTEEELIKLCHYNNLQPLCSKVNRDIKKNSINF